MSNGWYLIKKISFNWIQYIELDDKNIYRNQKALNQTIVYPYWEVPKFCDEHEYWDFFWEI